MKNILKLILLINLLFSTKIENLNFFNRNDCADFSQDECTAIDFCVWIMNDNNPNTIGYCAESNNYEFIPECLRNCEEITYLQSSTNSDELCDAIISINNSECSENCEQEIILELENLSMNCENCLVNQDLNCDDLFFNNEDEDECRFFDNEEECVEVGCNWDDEDGCYGNWDDEDEIYCSNLNYEECMMSLDCEWTSDSPNMPGMCVIIENECDENLICAPVLTCIDNLLYPTSCGPENCDEPIDECNNDNNFYECEELNYEECMMSLDCEWGVITNSNGIFEGCIENNIDPIDGCWEDDEFYCYGCEIFINDCQYYECTIQGWSELITIDNDDCGNNDAFEGTIQLENTYANPGNHFEMDISYKSTLPIGGIQFSLIDNPDWLYGVEFISDYDCFETNSNEIDDGSMIAIMFSLEGCTMNSTDEFIRLGSVHWQLSDEAIIGEAINVNINNLIVSDPDGIEISFNTINGIVNIGGLIGDINNDLEINVIDIVALVNFILQIDIPNNIQFNSSDFNQDDELNVLDVVAIVNYILNGNNLVKNIIKNNTKAILTNNQLKLFGDIGGIQFEGELNSNINSDDILNNSNKINLVYNLNGALNTKEFHFLNNPINMLVSDINGNKINIIKINNFKLNEAYPNPFNPITNISYSISQDTNVSIKIYDISGNLIYTLTNGYQTLGEYNFTWDASNYPSGLYFIQMKTKYFNQTKKLNLIK